MPDDLFLLERSNLLAKRHKRFADNGQAYIRAFKQGARLMRVASSLRALSTHTPLEILLSLN